MLYNNYFIQIMMSKIHLYIKDIKCLNFIGKRKQEKIINVLQIPRKRIFYIWLIGNF